MSAVVVIFGTPYYIYQLSYVLKLKEVKESRSQEVEEVRTNEC